MASNLDHIGDWMDYINEHKVYRYLYLVVVSYIWIKFKATRLYGKLAIWVFRKSLYNHPLFDHIDMMTVSIPSQIRNMGKKHAFMDFLKVESALFVMFIQSFIRKLCKIDTSSLKIEIRGWMKRFLPKSMRTQEYFKAPWIVRYIHEFILFFMDFEDTAESLPRRMISDYDQFLKDLPDIFESGFYSKITVSISDINEWSAVHYGKLPEDRIEYEEVRETIQKRNLRILMSKYDGIMFDYRTQIKKNLALQITSDLNLYDQIKSILKYSFQAVYKAMEVSLPKKANDINGELSGIVFDSFDCGERKHGRVRKK